MKKAEVILSPALLSAYDVKDKVAVIIDILRATTSTCVAFNTGVKRILPVSTVDEALFFKDFDFITAAERNAAKADGVDLGNSPFEYENPVLAGKSIALTTTNGTKAIKQCKQQGAIKIAIGSFLNLNALCNWINEQHEDILLVCSGWKDKVNSEDTIFAGAVLHQLGSNVNSEADSCQIALSLYNQHKNNLLEFISKCNHAQRFKLLHGNTNDIEYCLKQNTIDMVPTINGEFIIA
ncbi:MAG: 2-phosphosulfolactate phosphatase [Bacteroidia bacterium]